MKKILVTLVTIAAAGCAKQDSQNQYLTHFVKHARMGRTYCYVHYIKYDATHIPDSDLLQELQGYSDTVSDKFKPIYSIVCISDTVGFSKVQKTQNWREIPKLFSKEIQFPVSPTETTGIRIKEWKDGKVIREVDIL